MVPAYNNGINGISDFVVNFSSTSIKECVILRKPLINFDIKPFRLLLEYLYGYSYCKQMTTNFNSNELQEAVRNLIGENHDLEFNEASEKYLFNRKDVCKNILDNVGIK